jgi:hypothetical protein
MDEQLAIEISQYEETLPTSANFDFLNRMKGFAKFKSQSFDNHMLALVSKDYPWLEIDYKNKYFPESVN